MKETRYTASEIIRPRSIHYSSRKADKCSRSRYYFSRVLDLCIRRYEEYDRRLSCSIKCGAERFYLLIICFIFKYMYFILKVLFDAF